MATNSSILVTGGAGYIGSHCCKTLRDNGYNPVCYDNLTTGHERFVKWGPYVFGDILNRPLVEKTLREYEISVVVHLAASSQVGESVVDPQKYFLNNLIGSLSLFDAMRAVNCTRLVFSSSGAVYGAATSKPIKESQAGQPLSPYGRSKWMAEQVIEDYRKAYGFHSICLRYFNACGAALSGDIGEDRRPETHLIPRAMLAILGQIKELTIYGEDYDTFDGTPVRDYIHVSDLADAHCLAIRALEFGSSGGVYNLGAGVGFSVRDIVSEIEIHTGRRVPVVVADRRAGDPPVLVADCTNARDFLGFQPRHSDLTTIVKSAWSWHRATHSHRY